MRANKFSLLISRLGFSEALGVFQCSSTTDLQLRGSSENPPAVSYSPVGMKGGMKNRRDSFFIHLLQLFLLVPVILELNSKPADTKGSDFDRVAMRPPPVTCIR